MHSFSREILEAWRTIRETRRVRLKHLRGHCGSAAPSRSEHCPACARHIGASVTVMRELGIKPWEPPPEWAGDDPKASKLARALHAAIAADKRSK